MTIDRTKLAKLLAMTTSTNDGEALNAMRKANEMLARDKMTWQQVLGVSDAPDYVPYPGPRQRPYNPYDTRSAWDQYSDNPHANAQRSPRAEEAPRSDKIGDGEVVMMLGALNEWSRKTVSSDSSLFRDLFAEWNATRNLHKAQRALLKAIYTDHIAEAVAGANL